MTGVAVCTGAATTVAVAAALTVSPEPCAVTEILSPVFKVGTVTDQAPVASADVKYDALLFTTTEMLALSSAVPLMLVAVL